MDGPSDRTVRNTTKVVAGARRARSCYIYFHGPDLDRAGGGALLGGKGNGVGPVVGVFHGRSPGIAGVDDQDILWPGEARLHVGILLCGAVLLSFNCMTSH